MKILIIGCGLSGATVAFLLKEKHEVTIHEQRSHIGGNCYDYKDGDIFVHKYGAHIFHTNDKVVMDYLSKYTKLNNYVHKVVANTEKYGIVKVPCDKEDMTREAILSAIFEPYSYKQWGFLYDELPDEVKGRVKLRSDDDRYFTDEYQGIPELGYTDIIKKMVDGCTVILNTKTENTRRVVDLYDLVIMTGSLDEYFDYKYGELKYRAVSFVHKDELRRAFPVINECNYKSRHTRSYDNSYWNGFKGMNTVISYEFADEPDQYNTKAYPMPWIDKEKYEEYKIEFCLETSRTSKPHLLLGRMGCYRYMNMDESIRKAIDLAGVINENL